MGREKKRNERKRRRIIQISKREGKGRKETKENRSEGILDTKEKADYCRRKKERKRERERERKERESLVR